MTDETDETDQTVPLSQPLDDDTNENGIQKAPIAIADLDSQNSRLSAFIALALQLVTVVILIVFNIVPVWILKPETYGTSYLSSTSRLLYLTGTTILATIVSSFTTGQIRSLWFSLALSKEDVSAADRTLGRARTLIGLASLKEQSRHFFITASFWLAGLMTAAIVAGISATDSPWISDTVALLSLDHTGAIGNLGDNPLCFGVLNSTRYAQSGFTWPLGNGSYIGLNTAYAPNCETQMVLPTISNAQYTPKGDTYWMGGVPIAPLAAGVPYSIDQGFDYSFGIQGNMYGNRLGVFVPSNSIQFNWVTQCFPVLAKNPVTCRQLGRVDFNNDTAITVSAGGCDISRSYLSLNATMDPVTAVGICTDTSPTIGSSTIVIGSTHSYAEDLEGSLNKLDIISVDSERRFSLAVACNVDIESSLGFRLLNFSRNPPRKVDDDSFLYNPDYATHITVASNHCTPISPQGPVNISQFITPSMLATGGSASWQLLSQNSCKECDGYMSAIFHTVNGAQLKGMTLPGSQNYLEDILGQASAIALGLFWGYWSDFKIGGALLEGLTPINPDNMEVYIMNGKVSLEGVRAGTGSMFTLLYIIPEVFCTGLLIWLLYCTWHVK